MAEKLVRDKIPALILAKGETPIVRVLNKAEYLKALDKKLSEELKEYLESKELVELADLQEVIRAIATARGSSPAELDAIREEKLADRGGFVDRIALEI